MKQTVLFPALDQLLRDIEDQKLALPTLPDVAHKVQHMMNDINFSADQIVAVVMGDPAISAQIIKTANGGCHADKPRLTSVRAAVSRLGYRPLHDLLSAIITATEQVHSRHPLISKQLHDFWEHSREVATYCYLLAKNATTLDPELATLAGLVHEIGMLPLCLHAEGKSESMEPGSMQELVRAPRAAVSARLLHAWNFPAEITEAVAGHEDLHRPKEDRQASYTDVVAVANMLGRATAKVTAWENVTALERLYLSPEICPLFHERFYDEISHTHQMLFSHSAVSSTGKPGSAVPAYPH